MRKLRMVFTAVLLSSLVIFSNIAFTKDMAVAQASTNIRLSDSHLTLELGHYKTLKIYGTSLKASWRSSNNWVATVSSSGKVTAKAVGTATITATVGGRKLSSRITVLRINKKAVTMTAGQIEKLSISGTKSPVTWTSDNPSVAVVNDNGEVTAAAPGEASITAKVDGMAIKSTVSVIALNSSEKVMEVGGFSGYKFTLKINGSDKKAAWTSSNTEVATVSANGIVSAINPGSVTITATVDGKSLSCNIKVLGENIRNFTLKMGDTQQLEILGTASTVIWYSNKQSVATVENGVVSTVAPGSAIIMADVEGRTVLSRVTVVE